MFIQWAAVFVCSFLVWQSFIHIYQSLFFTFFCSIYYKPFFSSPPPVLVWFLVVSFWFSGWVFFSSFFFSLAGLIIPWRFLFYSFPFPLSYLCGSSRGLQGRDSIGCGEVYVDIDHGLEMTHVFMRRNTHDVPVRAVRSDNGGLGLDWWRVILCDGRVVHDVFEI